MPALWIPCDCCGEYLCTLHEMHAHDCPCPTIDEMEIDPYTERPEGYDAMVIRTAYIKLEG